jgi:hypothetical protein
MLPFSPNRSASPRPEFSPERKNGKVVRSRKEAAYALCRLLRKSGAATTE